MSESDFKQWLENFWKKIVVTLSASLVVLVITMAGGWIAIRHDVEILKEQQKQDLTKSDAIWYVTVLTDKQKDIDNRVKDIEKKFYGVSRTSGGSKK